MEIIYKTGSDKLAVLSTDFYKRDFSYTQTDITCRISFLKKRNGFRW